MQLKSLPAKILISVHRKHVVDKNRIKKKEERTKSKEQRG